jgi:hypothetical protein
MRSRGRPSGASLAVVPRSVSEVMTRLPPPRQLTSEEAGIWRGIVEGHPPDWFAAGAIAVLVQLCRHIANSNRLAELMVVAANADDPDRLLLQTLLQEQRHESAIIARLSTTLRLTPHSLLNHDGNKKHVVSVNRPWAINDQG